MNSRSALPLLVFLGAFWAGTTLAQSEAPYLDSIQKDELEADLYFLSSDSFRGRVAATPESLLAAEYIASRFQRLGLKPAGA